MNVTRITIDHVRVESDKPFEPNVGSRYPHPFSFGPRLGELPDWDCGPSEFFPPRSQAEHEAQTAMALRFLEVGPSVEPLQKGSGRDVLLFGLVLACRHPGRKRETA